LLLLLLRLLLLDEFQALVHLSCLAMATAGGDFPAWLAAAAAALEALRDWLRGAVLRRWHGPLATDCWTNE